MKQKTIRLTAKKNYNYNSNFRLVKGKCYEGALFTRYTNFEFGSVEPSNNYSPTNNIELATHFKINKEKRMYNIKKFNLPK